MSPARRHRVRQARLGAGRRARQLRRDCAALGFNCYRWHVPEGDLLYAQPAFFEDGKPTRSGVPILFPFPNRIRDGRFTWAGREYQLPLNDPAGKNAIHGFACRNAWQVIDQGADARSAWITGEFVGSRDAPLDLWPADYRIAVTYRFGGANLEMSAEISNPDQKALPVGLGYHPYFALSVFGDEKAEIRVPARKTWELVSSLPTGRQHFVDAQRDLRSGRPYEQLHLDDIFTDLDRASAEDGGALVGLVCHGQRRLEVTASSIFREIVCFTPPHRQAFCLEPYTCTTDAVNLEQGGVDAGWRSLNPGEVLRGAIHFAYRS